MRKQILFLAFGLFTFLLVAQQPYYNDVNLSLTGLSLKNALATKIINTHTNTLSYSENWDAAMITDINPMNASVVLLIYGWENGSDGDVTNDRQRDKNNNGGSVGQWNREHVYSRSLGTPNLGESGPGADAHHLRPADPQRNSSRGNKRFSAGSGNSGSTGTSSWYPGDEWKGDVARMMMYMYLRYDSRCLPSNVGIGNSSQTPDDMIDLFLQWNADDPVSQIEIQRNTYHGNASNQFAQGNRNPFIDNPYLATRIWGGPEAEDIWGIYTGADTEVPTVPTNVTISSITTSSMNVSWTASSDNVGVSSYEIYMNGTLTQEVSNTTFNATGLIPDTNYSFRILAKDLAENESAQSAPVNANTLEDTEAPTVPANVIISNETDVSFKITWDASSDNTAVTDYDIYLDNNFNNSTTETTFTVNGLSPSTTYSVTIVANDISNNQSAASNPINAFTTGSGSGVATDLFFSEYVEGSSNNKALELVNLTDNSIDLSNYSIRRQTNGGQDGDDWGHDYVLTGTLTSGNVFVIIHNQASLQKLIDEADDVVTPNFSSGDNTFITFNGNDPVGLFKNGVLIDMIGEFDAGSGNFAKDVTLRRKPTVRQPNTTYDKVNEWDEFSQNTVDDIGSHTSTLSNLSFSLKSVIFYPNPVKDYLYFKGVSEKVSVNVYSILGSKVLSSDVTLGNQSLDLSKLKQGIYLIRLTSNGKSITKKFIKSN